MRAREAHERGVDGEVRREDEHLLTVAKAAIQEVEDTLDLARYPACVSGEARLLRVEDL